MAAFKILFLCLATFMLQASGQAITSDQIQYRIDFIRDEGVPDVLPLPRRGGVNIPNPLSNTLEDLLQDFYYPNLLAQAYNIAQPARGLAPLIRLRRTQVITIGNGIPATTGQISLLAVQQAFPNPDRETRARLAGLRNGAQVNWIVHATIPAVGNRLGRHLSHNIII